MNHALAALESGFANPPSVFDEDTRMSIFHTLQLQASYLAALENTAARAIETGDQSALEDIERMAGGIKDSLRVLARIVIEVDTTSRSLSLVKDGHHAIAQN